MWISEKVLQIADERREVMVMEDVIEHRKSSAVRC